LSSSFVLGDHGEILALFIINIDELTLVHIYVLIVSFDVM